MSTKHTRKKKNTRACDWLVAVTVWLLLIASMVLSSNVATGVWAWLMPPLSALVVFTAVDLVTRRLLPAEGVGRLPGTRLLRLLAVFVPQLKEFFEYVESNQKQQAENVQLVAQVQATLEAYDLATIRDFTAQVLPSHAWWDRSPALDLIGCTAKAAECLLKTLPADLGAAVDQGTLADAIRLLYVDRYGLAPLPDTWDRRSDFVPLLAAVVRRHQRLRDDLRAHAYDVADIDAVLRKLPSFSLTGLVEALRARPQIVVDNMLDVLRAYGFQHAELDAGRRADIASALGDLPFVSLPGECARLLAEQLNSTPSAELLELLYRHRFGRPTIRLWSNLKAARPGNRPGLAAELARQLIGSGDARVPGPPAPICDRREQELASVLCHLEEFNLDAAFVRWQHINDTRDLVRAYRQFLHAGGVDVETNDERLFDRIDALPWNTRVADEASHVRSVKLKCLDDYGREQVDQWLHAMAASPSVGEGNLASTLSSFALGQFLATSREDLRLVADWSRSVAASPACGTVGRMLVVFLWRLKALAADSGDPRATESVNFRELVSNAGTWYAELPKDPQLVGMVQAHLQHGEWPLRLPGEHVMNEIARHNLGLVAEVHDLRGWLEGQKQADVGQSGIWDERLASVRRVEETLARLTMLADQEGTRVARNDMLASARDRATSDTYLLTFDSHAGPLAKLVDCLAEPNGSQQALLRSSVLLKSAKRRGANLYKFEHRTPYSRIGRLPDGMPFDEFWDCFCRDFELVLAKRRELVRWDWAERDVSGAEITMQLIDEASQRDYRIMLLGRHEEAFVRTAA